LRKGKGKEKKKGRKGKKGGEGKRKEVKRGRARGIPPLG